MVLVLNIESGILRAVGDSRRPFLFMFAACILNIVLDYVFVVYLHWNVKGVAYATVLSQVLNFLLLTAPGRPMVCGGRSCGWTEG